MKDKVFYFILGVLIFGSIGVYAAYKYNSKEVSYKSTTVEAAINELYAVASEKFIDRMYPIGSIYISTSLSTKEQVHDALGGTWESYGSGRTLVGVDTTQDEFKTVNKEGGEKTHTLTVSEMPSHNHYIITSAGTSGTGGWGATQHSNQYPGHQYGSTSAGGSQAHNNLQPYITVYMYKRTA